MAPEDDSRRGRERELGMDRPIARRDAITVNRWPHGYAYEYNPLWDPDWAAAYPDAAIDLAFRAVNELTFS